MTLSAGATLEEWQEQNSWEGALDTAQTHNTDNLAYPDSRENGGSSSGTTSPSAYRTGGSSSKGPASRMTKRVRAVKLTYPGPPTGADLLNRAPCKQPIPLITPQPPPAPPRPVHLAASLARAPFYTRSATAATANMVLSKKTQYVQCTPIPSFIPRELAIDFLHSHGEVLELNPLVTGYEAIKAPRDAPADEFYATWYEISERIQYIPGIGKLGSGAIKFRGVFHDLPFGLQTHTYAPANVDVRNKWQICGNQPGEPPEPRELGSTAPQEGLYIREDVEIKCNVTMVSFVRKEMKAAAKIMVERLIKKAELFDAGQLQAMMENGKLKTVNLADRSGGDYKSPQLSPAMTYKTPLSPSRTSTVSYGRPPSPYSQSPYSQSPYSQSPYSQSPYSQSPYSQSPYSQSQYSQPPAPGQQAGQQAYVPPQQLLGQNNVVMELPGDFSYTQQRQPSPGLLSPNHTRDSTASSQPSPQFSDARWSQASHNSAGSAPSSYAASDGMRSPPGDQKLSFTAELPTTEETKEEHEQRKQHEHPAPPYPQQGYGYPPQEYNKNQYAQQAPAPLFSQGQPGR